jgi:hypothetical protein
MLSLKRKQDLERQQEELKNHQRELERKLEQEHLQGEINAAEALHQTLLGGTISPCNDTPPAQPVMHENATEFRETVLPDQDNQESPGVPNNIANPPNPSTPKPLNPASPSFISNSPQKSESQPSTKLLEQIQVDTIEIQRQQVALMKKMSLPIPKPPVFSGNILSYPKWVAAFDALIDSEAVNPGHKLYYLGEYTSGQAQKMINGLLGLQTEDAYKRARQILKERFGDPFRIYEAYCERLKSWPACNKGSELQKFSDFVVSLHETMKTEKTLTPFLRFKTWLQGSHPTMATSGCKAQKK